MSGSGTTPPERATAARVTACIECGHQADGAISSVSTFCLPWVGANASSCLRRQSYDIQHHPLHAPLLGGTPCMHVTKVVLFLRVATRMQLIQRMSRDTLETIGARFERHAQLNADHNTLRFTKHKKVKRKELDPQTCPCRASASTRWQVAPSAA